MTVRTERATRLAAATVDRARAAMVPHYDRAGTSAIVHIGLGAFARAHLGVYADDLLRMGRPALVRGVSLRSNRAEEELAPQDCLYTVAEREPDRPPNLRVVGSFVSAATGPAAALAALTAPSTRLVTLTITEKGYDRDPAERERAAHLVSAPAVLARALATWRASGGAPPVIAPLDNVAGNGDVLRARVTEVAGLLDPRLPEWITNEVRFPSSVVDRMVPDATEADRRAISDELGLVDRGAVTTEHHRSWAVEADPALAPLGEVGVELVEDLVPFEQRKLWLLNGPHSALAYCGLLSGCTTIAEAARHPSVSMFVRELVADILRVVRLPEALEPDRFATEALRRFENPSLGHTCVKVAADGSRKLPQRFAPVVAVRAAAGLRTERFAIVCALWVAAAAGVRIQGGLLPAVEDPAGPELRHAAASGDVTHLVHAALAGRFHPPFVTEVAKALGDVVHAGTASLRVAS